MTGERVSATTPEIATAPARVKANSRKSVPVKAALDADRDIDRRERDRHRDDRPDQFARAEQRGVQRSQSFAQMALDIFHHHDGVIDHETDRKHDREQREQIDRESENLHEKDRANERDRDRDDRDDDGAP